jgi:hypothetical protein
MQHRPQNFSQRTFLLCLACPVAACIIAFFICYGRNIAWSAVHFTHKQHAPLSFVILNPSPQDEDLLECSFFYITLDVPASMARNAKIIESSGARTLVFADQIRQIRIPLTSCRNQRQIYGDIPDSLCKFSNTELLSHLYKTGTSDFSLGMSKAQLQEHDWAMIYRDLLAYGMHLENMTYATREDLQLLVLSADSNPLARRSSKWLAFVSWSLADNSDGGMISFFGAESGSSDWACRSATSLRRTENQTAANAGEFERLIASSTDDELLQKLKILEPSFSAHDPKLR